MIWWGKDNKTVLNQCNLVFGLSANITFWETVLMAYLQITLSLKFLFFYLDPKGDKTNFKLGSVQKRYTVLIHIGQDQQKRDVSNSFPLYPNINVSNIVFACDSFIYFKLIDTLDKW